MLSHEASKLLIYHAHHCLTGRQASQHILSEGALFDLCDEFFNHRQRDVGFQQRHAYFTQGILDIALGQARLATQGFNDAGKPVTQVIKHAEPILMS